MKQLLIFLITLLDIWVALAERSNNLFRGGTRNICLKLGKPYGVQTVAVPKNLVGFFTNQRRSRPAKRGTCITDGKAIKTLKKRDTKIASFCRKIQGKFFTTKTLYAATAWMLDNGFKEGKCTGRVAGTLKVTYVPPSEVTTTTSTTSTAPNCYDWSTGMSWCPELEMCIKPWIKTCPVKGDTFVGNDVLECQKGRCSSGSKQCTWTDGSANYGSFYFTDLDGEFVVPGGCELTCTGCKLASMKSTTSTKASTSNATVSSKSN